MTAMFEFSGQLSVTQGGSGWLVSFEIYNVGDEAGSAEVGVEIDNQYITTWSEQLSPSTGATPSIDVGAVEAGNHEALVYVNPGSGQNDHLREVFTA